MSYPEVGKKIIVTVPSTTANLGPGFDCLGAALDLYNEFIFTRISGGGDRHNISSGYPNATNIIFFTNTDCHSNTTGTAALSLPSGRTGATSIIINHGVYGRSGNGGSVVIEDFLKLFSGDSVGAERVL